MKRIGSVESFRLVMVVLALLLGSRAVVHAQEDPKSSQEAITQYADAANFQNNGAYPLALEEWNKFLTNHAKDPLAAKARHYQGVCLLQLKKFDESGKSFAQLIKDHPKFEFLDEAYLNLGWCRYSIAQAKKDKAGYEAAAKTFAELLTKAPNSKYAAQALFFQGESLYLAGKATESLKPYQSLLQKHKDSEYYCDSAYALGVAYEEMKEYGQAQRYYDEFLGACKEHKLANEVQMRKAEVVLQGGDTKTAETLFAEVAAIEGFESADHAQFRRAFCLSKLNDYKKAGEQYAALVGRFADSTYAKDATIAAGRAFFRAAEDDLSQQWFQRVIDGGDKNVVEAAHWICRLHLRNTRQAQALALADTILPDAGDDKYAPNLKMDRADALYADPDKYQEAQALYLAIADAHPDHAVAAQALYNAAFGAMELKQYQEAIQIASRFLKKYADDPLGPDTRYVRAESNLQLKEYVSAEKELRELAALETDHPEKAAWRVRLGASLYLQKKYADAEKQLRRDVSTFKTPDQLAEANFIIGACCFYQEKYEAAIEALAESEKANPKWRQADEALIFAARSLQKLDRIPAAQQMAMRVLSEFPESPVLDQAHYRLGEFHYGVGEFANAIKQYDQVPIAKKDSAFIPFALYGAGWSHLKSGAYPEATASFTKLLADHGMHQLVADARFARAMSRRQQNDFKGTLEDVAAFLESNPPAATRADAVYERGLAEVGLQDYAAAIKSFMSILTENKQYAHADKVLYELAWAYKSSGDNKNATAQFSQLGAKYAGSDLAAEALFHVAEDYYQQGAFDKAAAEYLKAKAATKQDVIHEKAVYKLGWSLFKQDKLQEALQEFTQQAERHPEGALFSDSLFMKGECSFKLKEYGDAMNFFAEAREQKPSSENIAVLRLLHQGQSANQLKRWSEGEAVFTELINNHPKTTYLPEAHFERGRAYQNQDQLEQAVADFTLATDRSREEVGARAGFMLGEVLFGEKKHVEAVRRFQRVMFGFGAEKAPEPIKNWQAKSAFEAGRCSEVLINKSEGQAKTAAIADAKKFYDFVVRKHPRHELAAAAKKRLDVLLKL